MDNWVYVLGGAIGSIGAFWIIINYVLNRLDSKVDNSVFKEFGKRISDNLDSGKRRFDKIDAALINNTDATNNLCREFSELRGTLTTALKNIPKRRTDIEENIDA